MRNIIVERVNADSIGGGVLAVDTDVLYQWRTLVPTYERRLTAIENIQIADITVNNAAFISQISGQAELPVNGVQLSNLAVSALAGDAFLHEHVNDVQIE